MGSTMSDYLKALEADPQFQKKKEASKKHLEKVNKLINSILVGLEWYKLTFSAEQKKHMNVDSDHVAFQADLGDFIIRSDFEGEVGQYESFWEKGREKEALKEFSREFPFSFGTPARKINEKEYEEYGWMFWEAILGFLYARGLVDDKE